MATNSITRTALYARISTTNNGPSPEMQLRELREYCERRGWSVAGEYVDLGISGTKEKRPQLDRLMADAHRRHFDALIMWKFDRFASSVSHLLRALETFQALGIHFVSLSESLDTSTPAGKMVFTVLGAVAELERSLIVERVQAGLRNAKAKGKRLGRPKTVLDVKRITALRATGLGWKRIATDLGVGKAPISIKSVDPNLTDEDLLEMANANLIPATITVNVRAKLWGQVLPKLKVYPNIVLKNEGQLAFATRKDSPKLNALLNEFIKGREVGTSFGNTLVRRYLDNPRWVKDATSTEEMRKFEEYVAYFKKYGKEYNFDYLMLMAQGYQESGLDQNVRSPSGATGIMQVIPKIAAASPINITNVNVAEGNIHAGAKMLRNITDTYLNDPKLDPLNKTLLAFAAYNAGPTRISNLREKAAAEGLNPDKWFDNLELVVAQNVGQQTVQYVSNIFKYYVAYKMTIAENSQTAPTM